MRGVPDEDLDFWEDPTPDYDLWEVEQVFQDRLLDEIERPILEDLLLEDQEDEA